MSRRSPVVPLAGLLAGCALTFVALWLPTGGLAGLAGLPALTADPAVNEALGSFAEVSVAVLGVAITVVAIVVQLAADRYTPRVSELFVRDPINASVMGFFVLTTVIVLWTNLALAGPAHPTALVAGSIVLMSASLLLLLPYFAYVFDFLTPARVIERIRLRTEAALGQGARGRAAHAQVLEGTEQLGELALNSVENHDKAIGVAAVKALAAVALASLARKAEMPPGWFRCEGAVAEDQDFVALHPDIVRAIEDRRTWVEMKVLRQYQALFSSAQSRLRDLAHLVAIHTRVIAAEAAARGDEPVLTLSVRFLNTYLRSAINGGDVRTAYNLFNEYRDLGATLLAAGRDPAVVQLGQHFKFYGQLAFHRRLPFLLETAAYDMCALLEAAHHARAPCHDALLDIFLELDWEPEAGGAQESSLRGVRKAQVKLATFYMGRGDIPKARRVWEDMREEPASRMRSIHEELTAITDPEYWEVSDRGINFDWLPPDRRPHLDAFFAWFDGEAASA